VAISLTSQKAVSRRVSPFSSVGRLVEFIEEECDSLRAEEQDVEGEPVRLGERADDGIGREGPAPLAVNPALHTCPSSTDTGCAES